MKLILLLLIVITTTEGYNISMRNRRDDEIDVPNILKIRYHHQNQVNLAVLKKILDPTLVGSFMGVWYLDSEGQYSRMHLPYHSPSRLPTFYHGVNSFSAITYFPSTKTLHGVVDQRIYIENLPLRNADNPDSVDEFIHPTPDSLRHATNTRSKRGTDGKRKSDGDMKCPPHKRFKGNDKKIMLYPEIFLVVDVPSTRLNPPSQDEYERATMYVLAYWNAIDMLFRNLKRTGIRINIAGILMCKKQDLENFSFVSLQNVRRNDSHVFMLRDPALDKMGEYFYYIETLKRNSYDFLVWMTSATLVDADDWNNEHVDLHKISKDYTGASPAPTDCGGMHYKERRTHRIWNGAIVMYDEEFQQYHTVARELAHLMFVFDDDSEILHNGHHHSNCLSPNPMSQSSGIMDASNKRLEGYLLWSYCSEIQFEKYSKSRSSCCLFNYPLRTLLPAHPPPYLTIRSQCECYRMRPYHGINSMDDICQETVECKNKEGKSVKIGFPLDGTPCSEKSYGFQSYCIDGECM